jgi:hypothetical protein
VVLLSVRGAAGWLVLDRFGHLRDGLRQSLRHGLEVREFLDTASPTGQFRHLVQAGRTDQAVRFASEFGERSRIPGLDRRQLRAHPVQTLGQSGQEALAQREESGGQVHGRGSAPEGSVGRRGGEAEGHE